MVRDKSMENIAILIFPRAAFYEVSRTRWLRITEMYCSEFWWPEARNEGGLWERNFNSLIAPGTFQVLHNHVWLVATTLNSTDTEHFHHHRNFY